MANFKDSIKYHNIGLILILTESKTTLWKGILNFSKVYTLNVFQVKPTRIGLNFMLPLSLWKTPSKIQFELYTPIVDYQQHDQKSFWMSSLDYYFKYSNELVAANVIETRISTSLTDATPDRIKFENIIVSYQEKMFGEKYLHYTLEQWKKTGTFDILNITSEYITLAQLMALLGNVNHAVSVVKYAAL